MPPQLRLLAVAYISVQNHPILIRSFSSSKQNDLKYHYIAHTSLDIFEERTQSPNKSAECYMGMLYIMDDVAVYGYITPLKIKIVVALAVNDAIVRDAEVALIFRALHMAYYQSTCNPFLKLDADGDASSDYATLLAHGSEKFKGFRQRVDCIGRAVGVTTVSRDV